MASEIGLGAFLYKRVFRPVLFRSRLARRSMMGYADSGTNFDYIYRNVPTGYTRFGKVIDSVLLNLPASKATRDRQATFTLILKDEITRNIVGKKRTRIVDLASGLARYLLEAITDEIRPHVQVLCLDVDPRVKFGGQKLAKGRPILFARADVFRLGRYQKLCRKVGWNPNVVIASGLYANYGEVMFKQSIREIYEVLEPGGFFIFDWLIRNPSQRLLEQLAITRSGKPWVMSYGSSDRVVQLVREAGFVNCVSDLDRWRMYMIYRTRKAL